MLGGALIVYYDGTNDVGTGGAWDNAKKFVEKLTLVEKDQVLLTVVGDTVGDPYEHTGPSMNI